LTDRNTVKATGSTNARSTVVGHGLTSVIKRFLTISVQIRARSLAMVDVALNIREDKLTDQGYMIIYTHFQTGETFKAFSTHLYHHG
jgi:hypothetical protein